LPELLKKMFLFLPAKRIRMIKDIFRKKDISTILSDASYRESHGTGLKRSLGLKDLTAFGIAAIIGAGIFSTIGNAAHNGGPAVSLLFIFTAIACGLSALCYAQFASAIPLSGSAYTYSYVSFGELIAWIMGWNLIMEYAVGNIAVAISWSDYFTSFLHGVGLHIPNYLSIDYLSASRGFTEATKLIQSGTSFESLPFHLQDSFLAWKNAPIIGDLRLIADIPAFSIIVLITYLVYVGIYESKVASNLMVLLKLVVLMMVLGVGAFYVKPENWSPFAPNGIGGVLKGISGVFFAYIGFDAISTTAEECKNPQRDLPKAMVYSLLISTVLYVLISLVLTGMVNSEHLNVGDPLAFVFEKYNLTKLSGIIAVSAVVTMASVLLVFQLGQPRIWMSMSRDGLLPKIFSKIHPKFKTPSFATILTGIIVAVPSLFMNLTEVTDLTSIGTLFAFTLVCGGVLVMKNDMSQDKKLYRVPYFSSQTYLLPVVLLVSVIVIYFNKAGLLSFFDVSQDSWDMFKHKIPSFLFLIGASIITFFAIKNKWSILPVLGLLTNLYLISELGINNWIRFLGWTLIGIAIYFLYSKKHSKLNIPKINEG
jgi:basic amino acid/polyamine antiporter, APA family